ncbi:hypothetical protein HAX54_011258, partial [Datura stramonium]|nr:hypothetical protein [Datura stramonium]
FPPLIGGPSFGKMVCDEIQVPLRPFTRSQARDLQVIQGLFMLKEVLDSIWETSKGFHMWIIALEEEKEEDGQKKEECG